jgi:adenosylcobyric acid synthase
MVQGTGSHAGKSVLAAALCRIYSRRGVSVAPFKAQNMSLNSFVTAQGGEMGRAQVFQAIAAGVPPHVDMNPVLLKPSSETGSQVVVLGRPVGNMTVTQYHAFQPEAWGVVVEALARLRTGHELVIIEGAGSSAEVNLRQHDIVNMRVARHAGAPVLLVGDIDRGGVFAALLGHMEIFAPEERALVAGYVINKFRGDASLLEPAIRFLRDRTGVPTLGVLPFLPDWHSDEEDSLALDERTYARPGAPLRIAVIRLPFISNYTDFEALASESLVDLRFVTSPRELTGAAAIVLPGTKSTIADLAWLRARGLAAAIEQAARGGTPVIGICGGYQMLGRRILDPDKVESAEPEVAGLGLLDTETTFGREKRTVLVKGQASGAALAPAGTAIAGYEIHMGRTHVPAAVRPLLRLWPGGTGRQPAAAHPDGAVSPAGTVCGTYVHGLFDHPAFRRAFLDGLLSAQRAVMPDAQAAPRADRNEPPLPHPPRGGAGLAGVRTDEIDRWADHVEAHLDMPSLDDIVGL